MHGSIGAISNLVMFLQLCSVCRSALKDMTVALNHENIQLCYFIRIVKVAGSRPDEVDFSNLPNYSGRTMALGSTQPLTEMSTRNLKKETWG
jgi:hypothetical protein